MFFLAGGVAFSILLAGVPFFLLLSAGVGFVLGQDVDVATHAAQAVIEGLLPASLAAPGESALDPIFVDVVRTRAVAGIWGGILFVWFSTRLFGSLRSVMTVVFERRDRNYFHGKAWDVYLTITSAALITLWLVLSGYMVISNGRVAATLIQSGLREDFMTGLEYWIGRLLSVGLVALMFFSLYRLLPARRPPWRIAAAGALTAALLFELARAIFGAIVAAFPPTSLYTGTLGALIVIVFWTYYAALIFVLGAEVAHAAEQFAAPPPPAP